MNDPEANDEGINLADDQSLSSDAFAALLAGGVQDQEESPEEAEETESETEETEEVEETAEESEEEEEETETTEELTADSLFKQLEGMTPEEIKALGKKLGSKAISRFGELTYRQKAAEEEVQRIRAQQQPAPEVEPVTSPHLEGVETSEQLADRVKELKKLRKDIESVLDDHEDYGSEDPIQVGAHTFTKKRLKKLQKEVTEALTEAVPSKQAQFAKEAELSALTEKSEANARAQVPELEDEDSEVGKNFKLLTESPVFKKIAQLVPDARPVLPMLAAHAVRSIYGIKAKTPAKPAAPGTTLKAKPPASPAPVAAAPTVKAGSGKKREAEKAAADFEKSGSVDSFARFLEARGG